MGSRSPRPASKSRRQTEQRRCNATRRRSPAVQRCSPLRRPLPDSAPTWCGSPPPSAAAWNCLRPPRARLGTGPMAAGHRRGLPSQNSRLVRHPWTAGWRSKSLTGRATPAAVRSGSVMRFRGITTLVAEPGPDPRPRIASLDFGWPARDPRGQPADAAERDDTQRVNHDSACLGLLLRFAAAVLAAGVRWLGRGPACLALLWPEKGPEPAV